MRNSSKKYMTSRTRKDAGIFLILLLISALSTVHAQSVDDVLSRIHDRYDSMQALRATFTQVTSSTYLDESERFEGTLLLEGDQYRIEVDGQILVSNTIFTWVYNRFENQVLLNNYEEDDATFSLTAFLAEYDTAYNVREYRREAGLDIIAFTPVDPLSAFREVTIWADDGVVVRLDVVDVNEVLMRFDLANIEFNPEIPDGSFIFSIPEGTEVIDLREN